MTPHPDTLAQAVRVLRQLDHVRHLAIRAETDREKSDLVRRATLLKKRSQALGERMRAEAAGEPVVRKPRAPGKSVFGGRP